MSTAQKTPLSRTFNQFSKNKTLDQLALLGLGVPGSIVAVNGAIVTVNLLVMGVSFPQVRMPVSGSVYVRAPLQPGDLGVALPASVYIGGVSGLGGGVADLTRRGNLSNLIWFPIGNTGWEAVDPNALNLTGLTAINATAPVLAASQNLTAGTGASGVLTDTGGQTATVADGIIVNID